MSTLKRAMGNSSIMVLSQAITWTASMILTAVLGRYLGDAAYGNLYLAMSFSAIFSVLVAFGLDPQLVRAVARDRSLAGTYLGNSLALKVLLAALAYGLIIVAIQVLNYPPELKLTVAVYSAILLFREVGVSFAVVYQAAENVFYSALGTVVEKVLVCALAVLLLSRGYGVVAVAAIYVTGAAVNLLWQAFFLRRVVQLKLAFDVRTMGLLGKSALPFLLYQGLFTIYGHIDAVLLSVLTEPTVVGWYGAAYRLFETLYFLPGIVSSAVMFPLLARLSDTSPSEFRLVLSKGLNAILILGIPICTGLFVLAEPILRLVYGKPEFLNAVPALRWLAVALFVSYVESVLGAVAVSLNQERKRVFTAVLATVINIGLNLALIPHFQHVGAAAVTAGTEFFILCYWFIILPKGLFSPDSLTVFLKATTAAAIMIAVLYALRGQHILVLVPIGGLVYCLSALLLRVVPPEDMRAVKDAIAIRRRDNLAGTETTRV